MATLTEMKHVFCYKDGCMHGFYVPSNTIGPFFCSAAHWQAYKQKFNPKPTTDTAAPKEATSNDVEAAFVTANSHPVVVRSYPPRGPMQRIMDGLEELTAAMVEQRPVSLESDALGG